MQDVREREGELHDTWRRMVGETTPVPLTSTLVKLEELTTPTTGATSTTSGMMNKRILDIRSRLVDDAGKPKAIPLEAVEKVRQMIGELTDPSMEAPLSAKQSNVLYGALKDDISSLVKTKGLRAIKAYDRAFEYSNNMHEVSEAVMKPLLAAGTPEKIVSSALSGTKEGASEIRTLFEGKGPVKGLNPAEREALSSIVLRRLGNSEGHEFDPAKFFDNWAKMHNDAKDVLFGKKGANLRTSIDQIQEVLKKMQGDRTTYYAMRNYALRHGGEGAAGGAALALHHSPLAIATLAPPVLGFITGRMISTPWFVKWLATATRNRSLSLKPALANLAQRAAQAGTPEDQEDVQKYIQAAETEAEGKPPKTYTNDLVPGIQPGETGQPSVELNKPEMVQ